MMPHHTVDVTRLDRGFVITSPESIASDCAETWQDTWIVDVDEQCVRPVCTNHSFRGRAGWESEDFVCSGAGGDYSLPGAKIQHLHSDIGDCLNDPEQRIVLADLPTPFIVANFPMVDFTRENGATRFVACTQRNRQRPPALEQEPEWMRQSIVRAPAGAALIRDVRTWHGGTANTSQQTRVMTSVGYYAPWFRRPGELAPCMPPDLFETLSERAQCWCRDLVLDK